LTGAWFAGMAASISNPSLSTLKRLHLSFNVFGNIKDPLYGICKELNLLSKHLNVIEEISIAAQVQLYSHDDISTQWGMLDTALSKGKGFPMLRRVLIDITVQLFYAADGEEVFIYERELDEIPTRYLPSLSSITTVLLCLSTKVHRSLLGF
jgi:hypothetical protein